MQHIDEHTRLLPAKIDAVDITTTKKEAKWLVKSAVPVSVAYGLQLSLTTVSLWTVGKLGKVELAAMSLCIVIVAVCGYGIFQGTATAIDTLAAQAFGRKDYEMVGVVTQRCALCMLMIGLVIGTVWSHPYAMLRLVGPEQDVLEAAAGLLQTMVLDIPAYVTFECAKHYFQVQGIFHAGTLILFVCSPLNFVLNYFLVLHPTTGMGLPGAPLAIIITDYVAVTLAFAYGLVFTDRKCWPSTFFSRRIFQDWKQMIELAILGMVMYEAEWLAFEIITLASSRLGTTVMAAQSIIGNICSLLFQIPMSFGLAASTRVGNLIGEKAEESLKIATRTCLYASGITALSNFSFMFLSRYHLGAWFSNDQDVVALVAAALPFAAGFQLSDSLNCVTGGILRGQGRQFIGSILNLVFYYVFAIPLAFTLAFTYQHGLEGLWIGLVLGLSCVAILQLYFVIATNWDNLIRKSHEAYSREA